MRAQLLVIAKAPIAGQAKTRLCPPCTPHQAAAVAAAALADTLDAATATQAVRHTLILSGWLAAPPGWHVVAQRGDGLADRIANAYADTSLADTATVLVGMDTPQLTPSLLVEVAAALSRADAVLGPAADGGWWTLGLRDSSHASALRDVPMSARDTCARTASALRTRGLRVAFASPLRDVDTAADAWAVAEAVPAGRFAAAVRAHVPEPELLAPNAGTGEEAQVGW